MILDNIKFLCGRNNISIAALEKEAKIGNGTIARWDESLPRVDSLQKVADHFGVTVDALLTGKGLRKR